LSKACSKAAFARLLPSLLLVAAAQPSAAQQPVTRVFTGARIVDGTGAAPIDNGVLVVQGDKITDVGRLGRVSVPKNARQVRVDGRTIMPGFINAHGHVQNTRGMASGPQFYTRENLTRQLTLYARYGVTSVLSLGGEGHIGVALRNEPASGRARLFVSNQVIGAPTAEGAAAAVDAVASTGADWLKIRVDDNLGTTAKMPAAAWQAAIERGAQKKLPAAVHIFYLEDAKAVLRAGARMIAHSVRDRPVDAELLQLFKQANACYIPTLMREVQAFTYESTPAFFADPFFVRYADMTEVEALKDPARQAQMRSSTTAQRYKAALDVAMANLKRLADGGVPIAMGTDTGLPGRFQGYFEHMELELMVKAGLTPAQAITSATGGAAACIGKRGVVGSLERGAFADFVVYRDDPTRDIRSTHSVESVWIGGQKLE
jgi:imidazolonepropionase-like amidohydrolase